MGCVKLKCSYYDSLSGACKSPEYVNEKGESVCMYRDDAMPLDEYRSEHILMKQRIAGLEELLRECNTLLHRLSCVTVYPDSRDAEEMTQAIHAVLKEI